MNQPGATCWNITAITCGEWWRPGSTGGWRRASILRISFRRPWQTRQQRLDDYLRDRPIPFFGWLRQIAGERVIDTHRRHVLSQRRSINREMRTPELSEESAGRLGRRLTSNDTSPSNRLIRKERHEQVMAALTELSPRDREVLVMRHLEQLATAEIADALGLSEGAVESRLLRALIRLRSRLETET